ncbi:hypothetical protein cypCar_00037571 [Cyprinus carpio]|nr:hypothetical protein cypCar_00037571 [Cyprinus carpio]
MNMYASVFFLTAMSVARYCSLSSSLRMQSPKTASAEVKWASLGIWTVSVVATIPHAVYSTTAQVSDDELCLVRFSDSGSWDPQLLLGLYQTQKVLLGFVIPLVIICRCYPSPAALRSAAGGQLEYLAPDSERGAAQAPNAFYNAQAYAFPITVCLAHTNSCLNPVLYCLIRQEYRTGLKKLLFRATPSIRNLAKLVYRGKKVAEAPPAVSVVQMEIGM